MKITINKNSLHSLSVVLSKVSAGLSNEVETMQSGIAALHSDFLDPSYDCYFSEYNVAFCEINKHCEELEILAVRMEEYYKKLANL